MARRSGVELCGTLSAASPRNHLVSGFELAPIMIGIGPGAGSSGSGCAFTKRDIIALTNLQSGNAGPDKPEC